MLLGQMTHGLTWTLMGILIVLCLVIFGLFSALSKAKRRIKELEEQDR